MNTKIDALVNRARDEKEDYIREVNENSEKMQESLNVKSRGGTNNIIYRRCCPEPNSRDHDIIAFRIILDTIPQCYAAMGAIHSMWKPIYYKIKDYLGNPKLNMYQSIPPFKESGWKSDQDLGNNRIAESVATHWS
jgi:GTP pyrophosphokinase